MAVISAANWRGRILARILLILLIVFVLGALIQLFTLAKLNRYNEVITQLSQGEDVAVTPEAPIEVLLARAYFLCQKNRGDEALDLFSRLEGKGNAKFRASARYNLSNLYLARAVDLAERFDIERAFTAAELAKSLYCEALRLDSHLWAAKYNLETALRLVPDLPQLDSIKASENEQSRQPGRWSSMPGFPRGLP
jgi:mxaK protein